MKTFNNGGRVLLLLAMLYWGIHPLPAQDYHLELVDIIHETLPGSRPETRFVADGFGGSVDFSIVLRSGKTVPYRASWGFRPRMDIINFEGGRRPDFVTFLILDDFPGEPRPRYTTKSAKRNQPYLQWRTQGTLPKALPAKYRKSITPFWTSKGKKVYVQKKTRSKDIRRYDHPLRPVPEYRPPGSYTYYTLHISGGSGPEIAEGFEMDVIYVFAIHSGLGKVPK
jgi:hypothetical protein